MLQIQGKKKDKENDFFKFMEENNSESDEDFSPNIDPFGWSEVRLYNSLTYHIFRVTKLIDTATTNTEMEKLLR